ncbi:hypothetical protein AVEN_234388-1 [Araneus ventricosus]|uniref:Uncharacterized protein n=1 Tax=Araneus ventricosus TaxID=182803 RepID=A0A4Y2AA06_ARAVE|nr:hypothetical protein AVEN_234388-1 [Araneus ventricosus]
MAMSVELMAYSCHITESVSPIWSRLVLATTCCLSGNFHVSESPVFWIRSIQVKSVSSPLPKVKEFYLSEKSSDKNTPDRAEKQGVSLPLPPSAKDRSTFPLPVCLRPETPDLVAMPSGRILLR